MGWHLCLWCSGGRWYCWRRLAVSLCLDLHAGGRLIKPKGEGQKVCHHISVQLLPWSWRRFMWSRQIDSAHTKGGIAMSVMLSPAHSCRLPDFIVRAVPLMLPWGLGDFSFEQVLEFSWRRGLGSNYVRLGRRWPWWQRRGCQVPLLFQ